MKMKRPGHHEQRKSDSVEWYTPQSVFDALAVQFDLDVCSPGRRDVPWIPANKCFTKKDDGLRKKWSGRVWMNPPFGKGVVEPWIERFIAHGNGIALFPARLDTRWFHLLMDGIDAVLAVKGRIRFISGSKSLKISQPTIGSLLVACKINNVRAMERSGLGLLLIKNGNRGGPSTAPQN